MHRRSLLSWCVTHPVATRVRGQADGYIELRIDWKTELNRMGQIADQAHVAILRVNPWLAYGCGEGARIAIRKPGALEGTASTVQRVLRDDSVVVRRDGAVGEVTVDPTPFTVVLGTNPRHKAGTRLLFVHENACVDAEVMPWPESEIDIKEGSRHNLSVQVRIARACWWRGCLCPWRATPPVCPWRATPPL